MGQVYHSLKSLKNVLQVNPNAVHTNGEDHLFLNPYAGPTAARLMSLEWTNVPIQFPTLGKFSCVKNLWFWMTTVGHPDILRTLTAREINRIQRITVSPADPTLLYRKGPNVANFRAIVIVGKYLQMRRMNDFPFLTEKQETLPWMIYKTESVGKLKSLSRYSEWYCKAMKDIYLLVKKELTQGGDSIANGELHKAIVENNCLDNRNAVYPYTADLLSTIVTVQPEEEAPREPKKKKQKQKFQTLESAVTGEAQEGTSAEDTAALVTALTKHAVLEPDSVDQEIEMQPETPSGSSFPSSVEQRSRRLETAEMTRECAKMSKDDVDQTVYGNAYGGPTTDDLRAPQMT